MKVSDIDEVLKFVNELLHQKDLPRLKLNLEAVHRAPYDLDRHLTWLTATLPAKKSLTEARRPLLEDVRSCEADHERMLQGLE